MIFKMTIAVLHNGFATFVLRPNIKCQYAVNLYILNLSIKS